MLKILLLGSGDFARGVLEGIRATDHQVIGFFPWEARAKPSFKTRIKRRFVADNVTLAQRYDVPVLQMQSANSPDFAACVEAAKPDVVVVAGWGEILKPHVIDLPVQAFVNSHPSLLPRHRGASPIASVLREGESETGVTFHYLTPKIDAGNILFQSALPVFDYDNYSSLARRIAHRAKETVGEALARVGTEGTPQDEAQANYFYRPQHKDLWLDWRMPAEVLRNRIRSAFGRAFYLTCHGDEALQILEAELVVLHEPCDAPGRVLNKSGSRLLIATGEPDKGLFVKANPLSNRLGPFGAKMYCLNKIHVGDTLGN